MNEGVDVCVVVGDGVAVGVGVAQKKLDTGVRLFVLLALPSCPYVLSPQHCTVQESTQAHEKVPEDETSSARVIELTETGCKRPVVVPSPSCPYRLSPQHLIEPSLATIAQPRFAAVDSPN